MQIRLLESFALKYISTSERFLLEKDLEVVGVLDKA